MPQAEALVTACLSGRRDLQLAAGESREAPGLEGRHSATLADRYPRLPKITAQVRVQDVSTGVVYGWSGRRDLQLAAGESREAPGLEGRHSATLADRYPRLPKITAQVRVQDVSTGVVYGWSGRRDLNPRRQPWQGCTLPLSYSRNLSTGRLIGQERRSCQALFAGVRRGCRAG